MSIPFEEIDWKPTYENMEQFEGLVSKTCLSGLNKHTVGGFYKFTTQELAQKHIDELLILFAQTVNVSLSVKLFNGNIVDDPSKEMNSTFF